MKHLKKFNENYQPINEEIGGLAILAGFVDAFAWMGHTRKLPNGDLKKQVGQFLKENAIKFEQNEWKEMCDKLERRGKKPWVDEM
jgi:hypothetical protein